MNKFIFSFILLFSAQVFAGADTGGMKPILNGMTALILDGEVVFAQPFDSQTINQIILPVERFQYYGATDVSKVFRINGTEQTFEIMDSAISNSITLPGFVDQAIQSGDWISIR